MGVWGCGVWSTTDPSGPYRSTRVHIHTPFGQGLGRGGEGAGGGLKFESKP